MINQQLGRIVPQAGGIAEEIDPCSLQVTAELWVEGDWFVKPERVCNRHIRLCSRRGRLSSSLLEFIYFFLQFLIRS